MMIGDVKMKETLKLNEFLKEDKWAMEHYKKLQEKYPDEWIIIKNNRVVKHGINIEQKSDDYSLFVTSGADIL